MGRSPGRLHEVDAEQVREDLEDLNRPLLLPGGDQVAQLIAFGVEAVHLLEVVPEDRDVVRAVPVRKIPVRELRSSSVMKLSNLPA